MGRVRQEEEEDRHHEEAGEENADRDQDSELREAGGAAQEQGEETNRGGESSEKNRASEILDRFADRAGVIAAVVPRLLITAENQDREIDSEPDENGAEADRDHVEFPKNQHPGGECDQTAKQERESHSEKRNPAPKTSVENSADQNDRAQDGDDDVVPHAQGNLRDVSGAAGHENFERTTLPTGLGLRAKCVHFLHQLLAIEGADAGLIRHHQENAHGPIRRSKRLVFFDRGVTRERPERGRDHAKRIKG